MLKISKDEAFAMRKKGYGDFVKQSHSRWTHYYLVEDRHALRVLGKYKKSKICR